MTADTARNAGGQAVASQAVVDVSSEDSGGAGTPDVLPTAEIAARLRLAIGRLARWGRQHGPGPLTAGQHSALATVAEHGPLRLTTLASLEGVSPPTVTRVVDGLVAQGLLERRLDARDGRCQLIVLSKAGDHLLGEMRTSREALLARQLECLTVEEIRALEKALPALERIVKIPAVSHPAPPAAR